MVTKEVTIQGRYQSLPTWIISKFVSPLKSRDGKSKLFPSCGSVEHCDSGNTSVAERNNTQRCGGIQMRMAQVYKYRGMLAEMKRHFQCTHSAEPSGVGCFSQGGEENKTKLRILYNVHLIGRSQLV